MTSVAKNREILQLHEIPLQRHQQRSWKLVGIKIGNTSTTDHHGRGREKFSTSLFACLAWWESERNGTKSIQPQSNVFRTPLLVQPLSFDYVIQRPLLMLHPEIERRGACRQKSTGSKLILESVLQDSKNTRGMSNFVFKKVSGICSKSSQCTRAIKREMNFCL